MSENFKRFQYFNFEIDFLENKNLFQKLEYRFLVESTKIERHHFHIKLPYQKPMLRIHWRLLTIIKQAIKVYEVMFFWYVNACIFWKCIQYTIHSDKTQILKKSLRVKSKVQKIPCVFFRKLQLITVLLLICDSYMNWSTKFLSLKLFVGFSIFDSSSFLLKFIFLFNKMHGFFDFKTSQLLSKLK